ncbi:MAG: ABC transporter ATP-binding protein [Deltaproteobacteria bacterium]|nr:ABC transporter ATP-binding protein [Deltaproteobacteria bacterium]
MRTQESAVPPTRGRPPFIEVAELTKRFDEVTAVKNISFEVRRGELFGYLGPNGAGKTTTINMLTGLAMPDSGTIRVGGLNCTRNLKAAQHLIGVVPDESNLYPELTGFDNLCFCAALYGMRKNERRARARNLLETFGLTEAANRKFAGYSKGMKRKLTIASGIIHDPQVLFLDEPTTGIDVAGARHIRQLIADLHRAGTTIFLTTHYIEEAERLCDRIAFIVSGRIVRIDTVVNLLQPVREKHVMLVSVSNSASVLCGNLASAFPHLEFQSLSDGLVRVESVKPIRVGPLVRFLDDQGVEVTEARRLRPSLEDVFIRVTGIEADAMRKEKEKAGGGV